MNNFLQDIVFASPWSIAGSLAVALGINSTIQWLLRPKNEPVRFMLSCNPVHDK